MGFPEVPLGMETSAGTCGLLMTGLGREVCPHAAGTRTSMIKQPVTMHPECLTAPTPGFERVVLMVHPPEFIPGTGRGDPTTAPRPFQAVLGAVPVSAPRAPHA